MKTLKVNYIFLCIIAIIFSFVNNSYAQCLADAGPDKVVCRNLDTLNPTYLGGNPTATKGIAPFTYTWEAYYSETIGSTTLRYVASDYLNDTTAANPIITKNPGHSPITFHLTVKDSVGNICKDSVSINFSEFVATLMEYHYNIKKGDSILLDRGTNFFSKLPVAHFVWRPNEGLSDSTSMTFWAKPNVSTSYYMVVTDSGGCTAIGPTYYLVSVGSTGISEVNNIQKSSVVYPNPTNDIVNIKINSNNVGIIYIDLFDAQGKKIESISTISNLFEVNTEKYPPGLILYNISQNGDIISNGKFIKR